jgi:hypothetical protein
MVPQGRLESAAGAVLLVRVLVVVIDSPAICDYDCENDDEAD